MSDPIRLPDWRELQPHPFAALFPLLEGETRTALTGSIQEHGRRDRISACWSGA